MGTARVHILRVMGRTGEDPTTYFAAIRAALAAGETAQFAGLEPSEVLYALALALRAAPAADELADRLRELAVNADHRRLHRLAAAYRALLRDWEDGRAA